MQNDGYELVVPMTNDLTQNNNFPITNDDAVAGFWGMVDFPFRPLSGYTVNELVAELVRRRTEGEKVNEAVREAELDA